MAILKTIAVKLNDCKSITLPSLFAIFFFHLLISKPHIDTGVDPNSSNEPLIRAYHGPEFFKEPNHIEEIDLATLFPGKLHDIDVVHRQGLMHVGSFILISDVNDKILVVQRSSDLKTCPNAWSFIGEHFARDEDVNTNINRCIEEELGSQIVKEIQSTAFLFDNPVFYVKDYENNEGRKDRQITYLVNVKLGKPHNEMNFNFASEVASHKWLTVEELRKWLINDSITETDMDFCDKQLLSLMTKITLKHIDRLSSK